MGRASEKARAHGPEAAAPGLRRRSTGRVALLLDGVSSPFNVGSIVRTAAAFKVEHIYLTGGTTSPAAAKAGKTALGTERYLSWSTFDRGADAADAAREDGFAVVGLELADHAVPLFQLSVGPMSASP